MRFAGIGVPVFCRFRMIFALSVVQIWWYIYVDHKPRLMSFQGYINVQKNLDEFLSCGNQVWTGIVYLLQYSFVVNVLRERPILLYITHIGRCMFGEDTEM